MDLSAVVKVESVDKDEVIDVISVSPMKATVCKPSQPLDLSKSTVGSATRLFQAIAAKHPPVSKMKEQPAEGATAASTTTNQTSNYQPQTSLQTTTATYQIPVPPHQSAAATATNQLPNVTTSGPVKPALVPPAYFAAASHMSTPGLPPVKDMARQNHLLLQQELISMQQHQHLTAATKRLQQEYITAINQIETNRYQTLIYNIGNDLCKQMTNSYYDHEWMMLIQKTRHQAATMCFTASPAPSQDVSKQQPQLETSVNQTASSLSSSGSQFIQQQTTYQGTPSHTSTPLRPSPVTLADSPQLTSDTSSNNSLGSSSPSPTGSDGKRKNLSSTAIMVLTDWYNQHFNHPYPSDQDLQQLATAGDITVTQVKKWMANKRVRSYNTLAFNGSIHPKKLKRLQREHMARLRVGLATKSVSPVGLPSGSTQTPTVTDTKPAVTKPKGKQSNQLNPYSQQLLNQWYQQHITNPYPTQEEKAELAEQGGITVKQVKYWFANKRSRSRYPTQAQNNCSLNMTVSQPIYSPMTAVPVTHPMQQMQGLFA